MGLAPVGSKSKHFPTINQEFKANGISDSSMFALCLGSDAGQIMFGGYDDTIRYSSDDDIQWFPMNNDHSYKIDLDMMFVGNVHIPQLSRVGLIDSGASWVLTSKEEEKHIELAFDQYCNAESDEKRCIGKKHHTHQK